MKTTILALTLALAAFTLQAEDKATCKDKAACKDKDKAVCSSKKDAGASCKGKAASSCCSGASKKNIISPKDSDSKR